MISKQSTLRFGSILKRDTLSAAPLPFSTRNQILYSPDPFPGYYCNEQEPADNSCKEFSYYIPFQAPDQLAEENLCRISLELQSKLSVNICPSVIRMQGQYMRSFRVKEIDPGQLSGVMESLTKHKFKLHKRNSTHSFLAHIQLNSFFEIHQMEPGIYKNSSSSGLYYLMIPEHLEWNTFEKLITYQKSNSKFKNFDAAIGYWLDKPTFQDFLRIYGRGLEVEQLMKIRKEFLKNMKRYKQQGILV
ncbi:MAG: hypothetical protein U9R60_04900 [Bacteroidota bacterium]|nr:hypothetical protein [Bacteroidota bacterium]